MPLIGRSTLQHMHVYDGRVWTANAAKGATDTGRNPADFVAKGALDKTIRLLGLFENADLVVRLYDAKKAASIESLQVCSPLAAPNRRARMLPHSALTAAARYSLPPSLGGFHEVTPIDRSSFVIAAALAVTPEGSRRKLLPLLLEHPVWPTVAFVPHLNRVACMQLFGNLIDPRWYIDVSDPGRSNKLFGAFNLVPKTMMAVRMKAKHVHGYDKCRIVLDCWKNPKLEREVKERFEITTPVPVNGVDAAGVAVGDFPWRVWGRYMRYGLPPGVGNAPDPVIGDLRASTRFLLFVREVWLDEIYRGSAAVPDDRARLFRPKDFFKYPAEITAFEQHLLKVGKL